MKFGMRKPSLTRSIKARTTGRVKRSIKKSTIPFYGQKGMGWIKNPKKALYNKVYNKTSFSIRDCLKGGGSYTKVIMIPIIVCVIIIALISGGLSALNKHYKEKYNLNNEEVVEQDITDLSENSSKESTKPSTAKEKIIPATDKAKETTKKAETTEVKTTEKTTTASEKTYILNKNSMKFHKPTCSGAKQMKPGNKKEFTGDRQEVIDMGYSPCGICNP